MSAEDLNKRLDDTAFNKISPFITLQKEEINNYNVLLQEVTEEIIGKLKEDDLFKNIYKKMMFVGSFYKQTRVGKPEEFDINVIIKLPNIEKAIIEKGQPGYAKIKFQEKDLSPEWTNHKVLKNWLDVNRYLSNEGVRRWFESISEKSLTSLTKCPTNNGYYILPSHKVGSNLSIKIKKSGPAFTVCVIHENKRFSVDLVPVLEFDKDPPVEIPKKYKNPQDSWYLVPKPLKDVINANQNWRYSFYDHEKTILRNAGKIKAVIRTVKKLRDNQKWSILPSYYIETLFFQELNSTLDTNVVSNATQTSLLIYMLKKLQNRLNEQKLYYFWDDSCNLFGQLNQSQTIGIEKRLGKIIKNIESQTNKLYEYILTSEELKKLEELNNKSPNSIPSTPDTTSSSGYSDQHLPGPPGWFWSTLEYLNSPSIPEEVKTTKNATKLNKPSEINTTNNTPKLNKPSEIKTTNNTPKLNKPSEIKVTNNASKLNESSEIKDLKDAISSLIDEVKLLRKQVQILENKIDKAEACKKYTTEVERRNIGPNTILQTLFT